MQTGGKFAVCVVVMALSGCQTNAEYQADVNRGLDAKLSAYHGSSMAEFIASTGMTPSDFYPVDGGRVFVFDGPPVAMTLPATHATPAVSRSYSCRLMLRTAQVGNVATADSWRIVGSQRSGPCNNLQV